MNQVGARSQSITDMPSSSPQQQQQQQQWTSPAGVANAASSGKSLTSLLSRATSVTTSSMSGRVKSAVGQLSSYQLPTALGERFSSLLSTGIGVGAAGGANERQRCVLVVDSTPLAQCNWAAYFNECLNQLRASTIRDSSSATSASVATISGQQLHQQQHLQRASVDGATTTFNDLISTRTGASDADDAVLRSGLDLIELQVVQAHCKFATISVVTSAGNEALQVQRRARITIGSVVSGHANSSATSSTKIEPDFVLVRQRARPTDRHEQFQGLISGLAYANVPSLQPYSTWLVFQDRAMLFGRLAGVQRNVGADNFPLIQQIYCQTHQELQALDKSIIKFPWLVRVGTAGRAKIKVDDSTSMRQLASIIATAGRNTCAIIEPFLSLKSDILIQRFGRSKIFAYQRKASSDKEALLRTTSDSINASDTLSSLGITSKRSYQYYEPIHVETRYRAWIEWACQAFEPRLDMCAIKVIQTIDDREFIVGMSDSTMNLVSENVDDDRKLVAELVLRKLSHLVYHNRSAGVAVSNAMTDGSISNHQASPTNIVGANPFEQSPVRTASVGITSISGGVGGGQSVRGAPPKVPIGTNRSKSVFSDTDITATTTTMGSNNQLSQRRSSRESIGHTTGATPNELNARSMSVTSDSSAGGGLMGQTQQAFTSFQNKSINFFKRLERQDSATSSLISAPAPTPTPTTIATTTTAAPSATVSGGVTIPPRPPKPPPPATPSSLSSAVSTNRSPSQAGPSSNVRGNSNDATFASAAAVNNNSEALSNSNDARASNELGVNGPENILSGDQSDDTMKNLRKTFAGIFGDM